MCRWAALAAACVACLAAAEARPPLRRQTPKPPPVSAAAETWVLQNSLEEETLDVCEVPANCTEVNANESNLCGVPLQSGVCYLVWEEYYQPSSPENCTLVGPTSGAPAVFASAGGPNATLGRSSWPFTVTGRVQLINVRLVSAILTVTAAELSICKPWWSTYKCAEEGGGIYTDTNLTISIGSFVSVSQTCAHEGGGVYAGGSVDVMDGSWLYIYDTQASDDGGGLWAGDLSLKRGARFHLKNTQGGVVDEQGGDGGGFYVLRDVSLDSGAAIMVTGASCGGNGGGFHAGSLTLDGGSLLEMSDNAAGFDGGGFHVDNIATVNQSEVVLRGSHSHNRNGGGLATQVLLLDGGSLVVSNASAAGEGGGLHLASKLHVSNGASLDVSACFASRCAGFFAFTTEVHNAASVKVNSSSAELWGGGFCGLEVRVEEGSTVQVSGTWAAITGGAFGIWSSADSGSGLTVDSGSTMQIFDVVAPMGFACYIQSLLIVGDNASLSIGGYSSPADWQGEGDMASAGACYVGKLFSMENANLTAAWETRGDTLVVDGDMYLNKSRLSIEGRPTTAATSALRARMMHLLEGSTLTLNNFDGDTGLSVGPANCPDCTWLLKPRTTFFIEDGSLVQITDSRAATALLSLNITLLNYDKSAVNTQWETNLSHVRARNCQGQLAHVAGVGTAGVFDVNLSLSTSCMLEAASSCPFDVLRFPENTHIHELTVECAKWEAGCEFLMGASGDRMQVISGSAHAACPKEASMVDGMTSQCSCAYPPSSDRSADMGSSDYCTTCAINTQYDAADHVCRACPWYAPWSQGESSRCLPWPVKGQGDQFLRMCLPAAALAMLALWMAVMLSSPLYITDMTWTKDESLTIHKHSTCCWQHSVNMGSESDAEGALLLTVQGPLVEHHGIRRFLWRLLRYRVEGTGAWGVDYQPEKRNMYMLQAHGYRTVKLVGPGANLDRASSQGRLKVKQLRRVLAVAILALAVAVLGPTWAVVVHYDPGHRVGHVLVSILYLVALWALLVCVAFPIWLRTHEKYYGRTPLAELHQSYRQTIRSEPYQGPDPTHPQYAGITAGVLSHTFNHYKSVVLDRNMHYVVANIVLPLTKPQRVSFAAMWGGRAVSYFVSHSWGSVHSEFVKTIRNHAQGSAGDAWASQAYWICSFSNNQWDISAALGETVMDSAFARVLRGGLVRGVVMVLDAEVQPLHRVWCLFEVLVSHSENLAIQYATAVGVIGDPRCTSVDVPLAIASRVETLRVAECESSSAEDKRKILGEVMARMGSLEAMDKHIGALMAASISKGFTHTQTTVTQIVGKLSGTAVGKDPTSPSRAIVVEL